MCRDLSDSEIGFYLGISSMLSALTVTLFQVLLKSNCKTLSCGCAQCERETTHNIRELELRRLEVSDIP
jgi:hypothetical protein